MDNKTQRHFDVPAFAESPAPDLSRTQPATDATSTQTRNDWQTLEGINIKGGYESADTDGLGYVDTYPGMSPFVRGSYPSMYVSRPWTIRQYAGFSTAK